MSRPIWYHPVGDVATSDEPPIVVTVDVHVRERPASLIAFTHIDLSTGNAQDVAGIANAGLYVSTVFLFLEYNPDHQGPPILWETVPCICHSWLYNLGQRYTSRRAAIQGHIDIVKFLSDMVKHMQPDTDAVEYLQAARFDYDWREHASEEKENNNE